MTGSGSATDLSARALQLHTSPTVAVSQLAAAMKAKGVWVFDFSVGEPDQPTPPHILAAAVAALEAGKTKYAPSAGLPELRAAVASRYKKDFRLPFAPEEVAITVGGKQALYLAGQCLFDKGDEVVIPSPYWPTFAEAARLAGARPIFVPAQEKDGFKVSARMISKATGPRTKAVVLNSPGNPTGMLIDPDELLVIGDMAQRRKFTLLYDDTYSQLVFNRPDSSALQTLRESVGDRLVIIGTTSKTYCMTGWRIGWVLGPRALVDACAALASHSTQSPTTFAQLGALEALTGPQKFVQGLVAEYRRRRDFLHPAIAALPRVTCVEPEGGFYLFPNLARYLTPEMPTTLELGRRLLEEKGVAIVPGEGFGAPGYIRISFARSLEDLREGAKRIAAFLAERRGEAAPPAE
jgi:aspartate aminotransferase